MYTITVKANEAIRRLFLSLIIHLVLVPVKEGMK